MRWKNTAEDEATKAALIGWSALVLIPGAIFVFGLVYLVSPRHPPAPQSWANGVYTNPCCAPLILRDGIVKSGGDETRYVVSEGKFGHQVDVARGIGIGDGKVKFEGNSVFVFFNKNSMALPALHDAESLHLSGLDDSRDYVFTKR